MDDNQGISLVELAYREYLATVGRASVCNHREVEAIIKHYGTEDFSKIVNVMRERVGQPGVKDHRSFDQFPTV